MGKKSLTLMERFRKASQRRLQGPEGWAWVSHHFMANRKGQMETDFIFLGSKSTVDSDCNHEVKRHLLLGRKAITNLDGIFKSRDITLPTKVHLVKAMVFPVVMYRCKSWTMKRVECPRIDAFKVWYWRRLLRSLGQQGDQTSQS